MMGARILILSPHPDDEVVGCCAAIGRAVDDGAEAYVLHLTTGVPAREVLWPWQRAGHAARVARRHDEARRAAGLLGLDGFMAARDVPTRALKAHLDAGRDAILGAIEGFGIDMLWVPAFEGAHQDHDAANAIAATLADRVAVWEFAEYNFVGGAVRAQAFPEPNGTETELRLTEAEIAAKTRALRLYASEAGNLDYVKAARECFRPLAAYDYGRPPHAGTLFYQRFQWVPFRHPRVDFARPDEVYPALGRFRENFA